MSLSLFQAFKVVWSFIWRAWLLTLPIAFATAIPVFILAALFKQGRIPNFSYSMMIPVYWLILMTLSLVAQALAMRWALNAKWSDFRIVIVPVPPETGVSKESVPGNVP